MKHFLTVILLSLGLIACGSKDKEKTTGTDTKKESTIVIGSSNFNGDFYGGWTNSTYDANIRRMIWGEGLMTPTPKGNLVLSKWVESMETSKSEPSKDKDDIWTFKLKDGLKFSNGNPLTVEDVKFTYDFWLNKKAINETGATTSLDQVLNKVEINKKDRTVSFYFKEIIYVTDVNMEEYILDSTMINEGAKKDDITPQQWVKANIEKPMGYGAYKMDEYVPSQYVKLSINPYYQGNFEGDKPSIDHIIIQNVPSETQVTQLVTGEIDVLTGLIDESNIDAVINDSNLTTNNYYRHGGGQITFHNDYGVIQLEEVRKAFAYEFDRIKFRNVFLGKYGISTQAPYSRNMWMMYDDDEKLGTKGRFEKTLKSYDILDVDENWNKSANIKEAHRLLDQAVEKTNGLYAKFTKSNGRYLWEGKPLELNMAITSNWTDAVNLTLTKDIQNEFGIKVNVESMDWSVLAEHLYGRSPLSTRKYHMFTGGTNYVKKSDYYSFRADAILPFGKGSTGNSSRHALDKNILIGMRFADSNTKEGKEQYKTAFRQYIKNYNEHLYQLPIYSNNYYDAYSNRITDFETSPMWSFPYAIVKAKVK